MAGRCGGCGAPMTQDRCTATIMVCRYILSAKGQGWEWEEISCGWVRP